MSGGVDSSTVAAMLAHEGANVVGLTLQLWVPRYPNNGSSRAIGH
jgi:tRNA U34 2-thiouridine synthase MnmA/TrmU